MLLENLHNFSNSCGNVQFNMIWHGWNVAALILCWRLAENNVTVMASVTCMDWLHWWYKHAACFTPPSSALVVCTKMDEKYKSTSPSVMQVRNQQKTVSTKEKLDIIRQLRKGERIVDICCNVRLAHGFARTVHGNADGIKETAQSVTQVFVCTTKLPQSFWNKLYQKLWMWVSCIFITLEIYIYRVSQEEWTKLREGVPYVKLYRYNPKHLCPKLNGY